MSFWLQVAEVVGTSAVISAVVNYALEQSRYKKEKKAARLEEHLKYSVENYPHFAMMLNRIDDTLNRVSELYFKSANPPSTEATASDITSKDYKSKHKETASEKFERGESDLLYFLGKLFEFEQEFQSKQGQMFRLTSQSSEITAKRLYELFQSYTTLNETERLYLAQSVHEKSLKDFRVFAKTDHEIQHMIDDTIPGMLKGTLRQAKRAIGTLSHLLIHEIDCIKLPGYKRKLIQLRKDDLDQIEELKNLPDIKITGSLPSSKIQVLIYNDWDHPINWDKNQIQLKVCKVSENGKPDNGTPLTIFDPKEKKQEKELSIKIGETLRAEWERPNREEWGAWKLIYLIQLQDPKAAPAEYEYPIPSQ